MQDLLRFLHMDMFSFVGTSICLLGLIICGVWYLINKKQVESDKPKKNKAEAVSEISRRKQEDDELTAIMREANSDELYVD